MNEKLAIHGGQPIRKDFLPYGRQWIDDEDIKAVTDVLKTDWITQGPKVTEFENKFANYCNTKYAVAFSSGTAALHAASYVSGISNGDEKLFSGTNAKVRPSFLRIRTLPEDSACFNTSASFCRASEYV